MTKYRSTCLKASIFVKVSYLCRRTCTGRTGSCAWAGTKTTVHLPQLQESAFLPRGRHTIRNISRRPSRKALDFELKLILLICLLRIKRLISAVQDAGELLGKREKI